jgi:hypothetical protein
MNEMTLSGLERAIDSDWARGSKYAAIAITVPGNKGIQIEINTHENIQNKLKYWKTAYNEDLSLKNNSEIRIVDYAFANTFAALEQQFVWTR